MKKEVKKFLKFMFVIILIIPFMVSADTIDDELEVVAKTTKYYKTVTIFNNSDVMRNADLGEMSSITTEVTEEEFNNAEETTTPVMPLGSTEVEVGTETTYKRLTTSISIMASGNYFYETNLYWKNIPKVRSYDVIGIGHFNDVTVSSNSTVVFDMDYCLSVSNCYNTSQRINIITQYGTAAIFQLPTESLVSLEQTLSFIVTKNVSWTITEQRAAGDYAHATKTITQGNAVNAVGINMFGLQLDGTIENEYYDTTPAAVAIWEGTW